MMVLQPCPFSPLQGGVYGLNPAWVTERAAAGWLTLNILPHDLPIDETEAYYAEQRAGPLQDYFGQGNEDRETSYFLRMYLSCYRAVEYLKSRPDWDGRTIVVTGTSQGGQQTFVTAGLHPDVTAGLALVPAGADFNGTVAGRAVGFPFWPTMSEGKDAAAVAAAGGYFDIVNFAARIKCPMLVGVGLRDTVCPPVGIFAAVNQLKPYHELVILPTSGHQNENGSQDAFTDRLEQGWLPALKMGLPAPSGLDRDAGRGDDRRATVVSRLGRLAPDDPNRDPGGRRGGDVLHQPIRKLAVGPHALRLPGGRDDDDLVGSPGRRRRHLAALSRGSRPRPPPSCPRSWCRRFRKAVRRGASCAGQG